LLGTIFHIYNMNPEDFKGTSVELLYLAHPEGVLGMANLLLDTDLNREQQEYSEIISKSAMHY
jgi:hypothetical protein